MNYWIKLHHSTLDDPKIGRLSDRLWRRYIELQLIAGECNLDGLLAYAPAMAWRLRIDEQEMFKDLDALEKAGLVSKNDDGEWRVNNFDVMQSESQYTKAKKTAYQKYLESDHWQATRIIALDRADYECERCGIQSRLEVHHLNYEHLGHETFDDLIVLCRDCHRKEHGL